MLLWKVLRHLKTSKPWPYLLCMHPLACSALPNCKSNVCPFKAYNRIKRFNNQPNRRWRWVPLTHEHSSWFYHPFSLSFVPALLPWRKKCLILETGRGWRHSTALTYSSPPSSPLLSSYAPLKDPWRIAPLQEQSQVPQRSRSCRSPWLWSWWSCHVSKTVLGLPFTYSSIWRGILRPRGSFPLQVVRSKLKPDIY